jgi:hypothetical protein
MKTLAAASTFALAFALAPGASAQLTRFSSVVTDRAVVATGTTTALTTWKGSAGVYDVFAPLNADQQAAELRGAIKPAEANASLPETLIKLPAYRPGVEPLDYGYANTDRLATIRQSEACPTGATPIANITRVWQKSATYGNTTFGSGYLARFTLGMQAASGSNDKLYAEALAKADVTVFGQSGGVEGRAYGQIQGTSASDTITFKVLGQTLWSHTGAGSFVYANSWAKTLVSAGTTIWVGPVPVSISGSASAGLALNASMGFANSRLAANVTPSGNVKATASAGVNLVVASAGVAANLNLIKASFPAVAALKLVPAANGLGTIGYDVDVDASINSLSGNVELWAKVWYLFGSKKWTTSIASWSGITATYPIVDVHGCAGSFSL